MNADTDPVDDAIGMLGFLCTWAVLTVLWTFTPVPLWAAIGISFINTVVVALGFYLLCLRLKDRFER